MRQDQASIKVQAKSLDLALAQASQQLGVTAEDVGYEIISQTNGGLLGLFGGRKIEISAWPKSHGRADGGRRNASNQNERSRERRPERASRHERRERPERAERPERSERQEAAANEDLTPLTHAEIAALVEELRQFCAGICQYIVNEPVKVEAKLEESRLVLDVDNEELADQVTKNPKLAESLEHILRKKPRHLKRELPFRIFVDVRGVRLQREQELVGIAQDLSSKVHANKKPIVLNYKSSYDRKVIHMALDQDSRVYTKSIGSGPNRKLMILPVKDHEGHNSGAHV